MSDNLTITTATGNATLATDDVGGAHHQRVKLSDGAEGSAADLASGAGAVSSATPRVTLASDDPAAAVLGATTGAAVTTDANGTIQQYLRGLIARAVSGAGAWVNIITGQNGVAAGTGASGANVQRTVTASDSPEVTALGATTDAAVSTDANGSINAHLRGINVNLLSTNTQLVSSMGKKSTANSSAVTSKSGGDEYEVVTASGNDVALGATGATGDYLESLLCVVSTAATSQVQLKDGSGSAFTVLPNNVGGGIGTYPLYLGLTSTGGAWKVTTAAGVSVIATGDFT
jgi:hypothetical protein